MPITLADRHARNRRRLSSRNRTLPECWDRCSNHIHRPTLWMNSAGQVMMDHTTGYWDSSVLSPHTLPAQPSVCLGWLLAVDVDLALHLVAHEGHLFVPDPFRDEGRAVLWHIQGGLANCLVIATSPASGRLLLLKALDSRCNLPGMARYCRTVSGCRTPHWHCLLRAWEDLAHTGWSVPVKPFRPPLGITLRRWRSLCN